MQTRRKTLQHSAIVAGMLAATGLFPGHALAFNAKAFDAKTVSDALKALGAAAPTEIKMPRRTSASITPMSNTRWW